MDKRRCEFKFKGEVNQHVRIDFQVQDAPGPVKNYYGKDIDPPHGKVC